MTARDYFGAEASVVYGRYLHVAPAPASSLGGVVSGGAAQMAQDGNADSARAMVGGLSGALASLTDGSDGGGGPLSELDEASLILAMAGMLEATAVSPGEEKANTHQTPSEWQLIHCEWRRSIS